MSTKIMVLLEIPSTQNALTRVEALMKEVNGNIHETVFSDPLEENEYVTIKFVDEEPQ
jgi:hypothetical protein